MLDFGDIMHKIKVGFTQLAVYTVIIILIGIAVGRLTLPLDKPTFRQERTISVGESNVVTYLPAVDERGEGVLGVLETTVKPGSGLVLVNVNNLLAQFDTQLSGRTAAQAAANYTGIDLSKYDIIYNIRVNATIIEGPSAGAALAVSIIAALENKTLDSGTMITGTISSDGSIGRVGAIAEKAAIAKEEGATRFLVPEGQSSDKQIKRERLCSYIDSVQYCKIKYVPKTTNIGESIGIEVIEVGTVEEAVKYFLE